MSIIKVKRILKIKEEGREGEGEEEKEEEGENYILNE